MRNFLINSLYLIATAPSVYSLDKGAKPACAVFDGNIIKSFIALMSLFIMAAYPSSAVDNPEASLSSYSIINSSQIIDQISSENDIAYNNIVVIGDLCPGKRDIKSSIKISNSVFIGDVNFNHKIFYKPVEFENAVFKKRSSFDNAQFEEHLIFLRSRFEQGSSFKETQFKNDTIFSYTIFNNDYSNFRGSQFWRKAAFDSTRFNKFAIFDHIKFQGDADFKYSEFINAADFSFTTFEGKVDFLKSIFKQRSFFNSAKFMGYAGFDAVNFENNVHFDKAEFRGDFILSNTTIHRIWINDAKFFNRSHMSLNDSDFAQLNTDWDSISDRLYCNSFVYQALIKNFHELRDFKSEDNCYYQYRDFERRHLEDYILWITSGYGVRPWRAIGLSILVILAFAVIYYRSSCIHEGLSSNGKDRRIDALNAIYFSLATFISTPTNFRPFGKYKNLLKYLIILERLSGWFMLAIFIIIINKIGMR